MSLKKHPIHPFPLITPLTLTPQYPVGAECLRPQSNPTYYEDLMRDFEEAPTRRWWQLWILKLKGKFRFR